MSPDEIGRGIGDQVGEGQHADSAARERDRVTCIDDVKWRRDSIGDREGSRDHEVHEVPIALQQARKVAQAIKDGLLIEVRHEG